MVENCDFLKQAKYTVTGTHQEPVYRSEYYYKNWFCKLFKIKTWYQVFDRWETVTDKSTVEVKYSGYTPSETYLTAVARIDKGTGGAHYSNKDKVNRSYALCLANTDNDSSYMNYAGKHYYTYTDPQVLAVLASPPYFADLLDRYDLSGNYPESTTSYSSSASSASAVAGSSVSHRASAIKQLKIRFFIGLLLWFFPARVLSPAGRVVSRRENSLLVRGRPRTLLQVLGFIVTAFPRLAWPSARNVLFSTRNVIGTAPADVPPAFLPAYG